MYVNRFVFTTVFTIGNNCCKTLTAFKLLKRSLTNSEIQSKTCIAIPDLLINDYVWKNLHQWRNNTAVICFETGRSYTYQEIHNQSHSLAYNLRNKLGLKLRNTVALILPNIPEFPIALLGSLQAGLIVTTINPFYTKEEIVKQLEDCDPKLIFTTQNLHSTISKSLKLFGNQIPIILTDPTIISNHSLNLRDLCVYESNKLECDDNSISPEDVALLPYSSGTMGLPKGVQLTHRNVVSNLSQMSSREFAINLKTVDDFQDVIPIFLPMFHIYGLVAVFLNFFSRGCKLITVPHFVPSQFGRLLHDYQPTLIFAVPQIISLLLNSKIQYEDLKSVRVIISAAAPLGESAFVKFLKKTDGKIKLLQMYGMTETSPLTLMQSLTLENGLKIGGAGFLLPNTQCKIVDLNSATDSSNLKENQTGELLIKGPQVMKGYHNNWKATREVLTEDKWLRTGDVGHYDKDQHFFITDRLKELIKVKGFQVAPAELEEILRTHVAVADVAVVGVPHKVQGEAPKAFIVLRDDFDVKGSHFQDYLAKKVANYKRLVGGVVIVDRIPRNDAGKVLRRELKSL